MRPDLPLISIVAPVYNEEGGIRQFHERVTRTLTALTPPVNYELILVNDGSTDDSAAALTGLLQGDNHVRLLELSRNFGHQKAITAGLDYARGDAVVVIDSDLQDPPEVIGRMVTGWRAGADVVYGVRTRRSDESHFKLVTASVFYRFLNWLSDTPLPLDAGDFRLIDRRVLNVLHTLREDNRYLRGMVAWAGFRQTAVAYEREARVAGSTNYSLPKMVRLAVDAVTSFSEKPLRVAWLLGIALTSATFLLAAAIVVGKLVEPSRSISGYASLMVVILFLGGVQLFTIGLLGEYVGRIYRESKNRPLYVVAEARGFSDTAGA